ncbi:hypothetical protein OG209_31360 [Streptomyces sp. NBC_01383]|uniref:hypothetical protein n=1 Tax=Streptomyces sp. NBC_01383 TaxID=2903846 RepID=UPI0032553B67
MPPPRGIRPRSAAELTRCEQAALDFIADDLRLDLAPGLHAASPDSRLLALEDLYPRTELAGLLHRDGHTPALDAELTAFASSMGEPAAASAGRAALFNARRTALGTGAGQLGDREHACTGLWRNGLARAAAFGVPLPTAAERDLEAAVAELADPGPFLALTNGDTESHNVLAGPSGGGRLIDFERAGFRHALTAATGFAVPGPNWSAVSGPGQVEAFRRALARTVPRGRGRPAFRLRPGLGFHGLGDDARRPSHVAGRTRPRQRLPHPDGGPAGIRSPHRRGAPDTPPPGGLVPVHGGPVASPLARHRHRHRRHRPYTGRER